MIDDLESGYYETDDEEDKNAFEITLEYINRRGHHILQYNTHSEFHAIVGTMREGQISFAYHGEPTALVWYKNKQGVYQRLSVVDPSEQPAEDQLFSSLLQGQIQKNDFFFVTTPHVPQYFSEDRLEKIITTRSPRQSTMHIQKVLTNLRSEESFGGILFHLMTQDQLPKTGKMPEHLKQDSAGSLQKLISNQRQTDETLNPPMLSRAAGAMRGYIKKKEPAASPTPARQQKKKKKRVLQTTESRPETNHRVREPQAPSQSMLNTVLIALGKGLVAVGQVLLLLVQRVLLFFKEFFIGLFFFATNKDGKRQAQVDKMRSTLDRRVQSFTSLPLMSKILFIATIIFALIFVGSIVFLKVKESRDAAEQAYQNMLQAIVDKRDAAEASMIYGDDTKAFTLLQEAKTLVTELPNKTEEQITAAQELESSVETSLLALRKIELVEPTLLADLGTLGDANATAIDRLGNTLVAYGPSDPTLYLVNEQTGTIDTREHTSIPNLTTASTPKENDFSLFVSGKDALAQLTPEGYTLSSKEIGFPTDVHVSDIFVYNRRAYTLDQANGQIYKHSVTGSGYDQGSPWIKERSTDLSDAVSLAIDGDIFVLKGNGTVVKFEAGTETTFSIVGLDPALSSPTKLWTYNDVDNIYILEPAGKRIVILNKEGKLERQLTAEAWQNPTGMLVDEENNTLYVLDANKVYTVAL